MIDVPPLRSCITIPCPITGWRRPDEVSVELLRVVREAAHAEESVTITWSDEARGG